MPASSGTERQEEDKQLFDLDKHRSHSRQQLLSCRGQLAMKQKAKRRAELCMAEIQPLPESTQTFKAVGRMFLSAPLPSILSDLAGLVKSSEDDLATLQGQEKYLVKDLETTEQSIEEIVGKEQKAQ